MHAPSSGTRNIRAARVSLADRVSHSGDPGRAADGAMGDPGALDHVTVLARLAFAVSNSMKQLFRHAGAVRPGQRSTTDVFRRYQRNRSCQVPAACRVPIRAKEGSRRSG